MTIGWLLLAKKENKRKIQFDPISIEYYLFLASVHNFVKFRHLNMQKLCKSNCSLHEPTKF